MRKHWFHILVLLFLALLAPLLSLTTAQGAPGDYLFQWGPQRYFWQPYTVSVDGDGNVYVADGPLAFAIKKFDKKGTLITQWGSLGTGDGEFTGEVGAAFDPTTGSLFLADTNNARVRRFDSAGNLLAIWGSGAVNGRSFAPVGIAVDRQGDVFVADGDHQAVFKFSNAGTLLTQWYVAGASQQSSSYPSALAVDTVGNVYVVDTNRIVKYDNSGTYLAQWGGAGATDGSFAYPSGVAVDSSGNVYVSDSGNHRVQKFDGTGTFLGKWGTSGAGPGQFRYSAGSITVDGDGVVYVVDDGNLRVQKFTGDGAFLGQIGNSDGNGQFNAPIGLAVTSGGDVLVADSGNSRVQRFDSLGQYLTQWGGYGEGYGQFSLRSLALNGNGDVYLADSWNSRIQKFGSAGNYLLQWGSAGSALGQFSNPAGVAAATFGTVFVCDTGNDRIEKISSFGTSLQWAQWGPITCEGLAVDGDGNVYAGDVMTNSIKKFNSDGVLLLQWGSGVGDGDFNPHAVALDQRGNVYVLDRGNNRVEVFDTNGAFKGQWGGEGFVENGKFFMPEGIASNASGTIVYVADTLNERIQAFTGYGTSFTLSYSAAAGGSISGAALQTVAVGGNGSAATAVPDAGYHFIGWSDGGTTASRTDTVVTANLSVTANFAAGPNRYTLSYSAGTRGTISGAATQTVAEGESGSEVTAVPTTGYHFGSWSDGVTTLSRTDSKVLANLSVTAKFAPDQPVPGDFLVELNGSNHNVIGLAVDSAGKLYVGDAGTVSTFDPQGKLLANWPITGQGPLLSDIAVDACGNVYVADFAGIQKYTAAGQFLFTFGSMEMPVLPFFSPDAVAADSSCNSYVVDYHNSQVVRYSSSGIPQAIWDRSGLFWPFGIAVDAAGNAYVADTYHDRIVKFSNAGTAIAQWGETGTGNGQMQRPFAVAVDAGGNVYVADTTNNRVQVFSDSGSFLGQWNGEAVAAGRLLTPWKIATNKVGTVVYVSDRTSVLSFAGYGRYTLVYRPGSGGTLSGAAEQKVLSGGSGTPVTAVANRGYHFVSWSDGLISASRTDGKVQADLDVTANFAADKVLYTVSFTAGSGGTIQGATPQSLPSGGNSSPVSALAKTGYHFVKWTGDGSFRPRSENPLIVKGVTANLNIKASFEINRYRIDFIAGPHGAIKGDDSQTVAYGGGTSAVTAVPDRHYRFVNWTDECRKVLSVSAVLRLSNVTDGKRITANFEPDKGR